ncbi:helix-turn-helix domain-containing protein [Clostridium carnis]
MFIVEDIEYHCPVEALSSILGKKWVASLIWTIKNDKKRFGELQRNLEGCSKKMLTQQLDLLINNGIVINEKININNTIESSYFLSENGKKLLPTIESMILWGEKNLVCK